MGVLVLSLIRADVGSRAWGVNIVQVFISSQGVGRHGRGGEEGGREGQRREVCLQEGWIHALAHLRPASAGMTGGGVRELGACEGLGVLDEVCGLVDKPLDGVYRLAPAGVEAVAVEGALSSEIAVPKVADLRIVLSELQEGAGGVGGLGGEFTGACEDEGVGGRAWRRTRPFRQRP